MGDLVSLSTTDWYSAVGIFLRVASSWVSEETVSGVLGFGGIGQFFVRIAVNAALM